MDHISCMVKALASVPGIAWSPKLPDQIIKPGFCIPRLDIVLPERIKYGKIFPSTFWDQGNSHALLVHGSCYEHTHTCQLPIQNSSTSLLNLCASPSHGPSLDNKGQGEPVGAPWSQHIVSSLFCWFPRRT